MNMQEILVANGASAMLLAILLICRHKTRRNRRVTDKIFSFIIYLAVVGTFLETMTFVMDGHGGAFLRVLNFFCNSVEYACTTSAATLWVFYVDMNLYRNTKRLNKIYVPVIISWSLMMVLLIGNIFGGYAFTVDGANVYHRQPFGYIFYVHLLGCYIVSIIIYLRFRANHGKAQFFPIWMFMTPLFISIFIAISFYGISVSFLGCSIGLVGLYVNIQSKISLVDGRTGLYNRAYIEHAMIDARHSKRYIFSGIMLDIDNFKQINDTYGHSVGDDALVEASRMLVNATDRNSVAFRYAGDEFIVLVRMTAGNAEELRGRTLAVMDRITAETEKFNSGREVPYRIVFSMGYSMFDTDHSDDEFFHNMDLEMYKDKHRHKELEKMEN